MENKVNTKALRERIEVMKKSNSPLIRRMAQVFEQKLNAKNN